MEADQYVYSFWFWVPAQGMWPAYAVSMVILALFTIGLWTRVTAALALFVAISYANRVPAALFGLDQINIMLTLYLTIGPSGQSALPRSLAGGAPAGPDWRHRRAERRGQPGTAADPGAHVRHLFFRGHLEAAGAVLVERARRCGGPSRTSSTSRST